MKRKLFYFVAIALLFFLAQTVRAAVTITSQGGWFESAYVEFTPESSAAYYNAYYSTDKNNWTKVDDQLVRKYSNSKGRVDVIGIKAGSYYVKVESVSSTGAVIGSSTSNVLTVKAHDRGGFAHKDWSKGVGAYDNNGVLKSGARVIYVASSNAKTVKLKMKTSSSAETEFTGLQAILGAYEKGYETRPLAIRIIGTLKITDLDSYSSSEEGIQIKGKGYSDLPLTIEGVGNDAVIHGFGLLIRGFSDLELRNFAVMNCLDDCISLDTKNSHVWVHNLDLFYGQTGSAADQKKGDGTVDMKGDSKYITVSYNHFWDSGKSSLCGMKSETGENFIAYHHNWFDHSDSRHPRIRTMSVHVYNNYFDGNSKYGVGVTMGASAFVESNYFRNCKNPMMRSLAGTDAKGEGTFSGEATGWIKAYGNIINGASSFIASTNSASSGISETITSRADSYDAVVVSNKATTLSDGYTNFDSDMRMHTYTPDAASAVPDIVKGTYGAGRMQHGNYSYTFSSSDDSGYAVIDALKSDVTNFPTNAKSFNATSSNFFKADALGAETESGSGSGDTGGGETGDTGGGETGDTGGGSTDVTGNAIYSYTVTASQAAVTNATATGGTFTSTKSAENSGAIKIDFANTEAKFIKASITGGLKTGDVIYVKMYQTGSDSPGTGYGINISTAATSGNITTLYNDQKKSVSKDYSYTVGSSLNGVSDIYLGRSSSSIYFEGIRVVRPDSGSGSGSGSGSKSNACDVLSASVEGVAASISGTDITVTIPYAADAITSNLVAEFTLSDKVSKVTKTDGTTFGTLSGNTWTVLKSLAVTPGSTNSQTFIVVAEDGTTKKTYKLTMTRGADNTTPVTYTVSGSAYPVAGGTVTVSKSTANAGESVTFTATPNSGYKFKQWDDESTSNPYSKTINENTTLVATFIALSTDATLSNIRINGNNLATFATGTTSYTYELPYGTTAVPTVTATATNSGATVNVIQATATNGTTTIKVTAESGATKTYTIQFSVAQNASSEATGDQSKVEYKGWFEAAYVKFLKGSYPSYNVYIAPASSSDWTKLDEELVREYATYVRADAVGLKAGSYKFKIVPVSSSSAEVTKDAIITDNFTVSAHDRSGFAHADRNGVGIGAYNNDGTLKANARILYVTADNAKTIKCNVMGDKDVEYTGLQAIIAAYEKGKETRPLDIRFIGTVKKDDLDAIGSSAEGLQVKGSVGKDMNITIEGIGEDAAVHGFGFLVRNAQSVEFRNFAIMICLDDCLSLDTENHHCWVHNMDFFYGGTGSDADQAKGDGTVDIKGKSSHNTVSYNHFYDSGKCSLGGMKSETTDCWMTYHHNWFDHSDSRHPRIRTAFYHIYNNYFDGCAKYGTGVTMGGSAFVEQNYYRNTKYPMLISLQGTDAEGEGTFSGEAGGVIKAYRNVMVNPKKIQFYDGSQTDGKWDAVLVQERGANVSATAYSGGTAYNNAADAAARSQYIENKIDDPENIPAIVKGWLGAGRMNHGDFTWTFSNAAQDENYGVVGDLKATLLSYTSPLVGFYGGAKISNGGAVTTVNAGDGKGLSDAQQDYTPSWGSSYYAADYHIGDDTGATTGGGGSTASAGVPYIYGGTAEAPEYYWFNSSNSTTTASYISNRTIVLDNTTVAESTTPKNSDSSIVSEKTGTLQMAASNGAVTFYCADGFTSAKFYLFRTGSFAGSIEGSADGNNYTSLMSLSASKGSYEPSVNVASGTKYIRIKNTATGALHLQGAILYKEDAATGGSDTTPEDPTPEEPTLSDDASATFTLSGESIDVNPYAPYSKTIEADDAATSFAVVVSPAAKATVSATGATGSGNTFTIAAPAQGNTATAVFTVTAEDGETQQAYTINITRKVVSSAGGGESIADSGELLMFPYSGSFYTISGSTSTTKGTVTVDGTSYSTCLKMESATTVTFTTTKDASMKLVMLAAGNTIKVDGSSWTAGTGGVIEIDNLSAGNHTITKDGSYNLFYAKLTYAEEEAGGEVLPTETKLELIDGVNYTGTVDAVYPDGVTYTRSISSTSVGKWTAIYVPFSIDVVENADMFDIAEIYAFCPLEDTNKDGELDSDDEAKLIVRKLANGYTLPNKPYLIRPKVAGTIEINAFDNKVYAAPINNGYVNCATTKYMYTITGTYTTVVATPQNNYYYTSGGSISHRTSGSTNINCYRWYMTVSDRGVADVTQLNARPTTIYIVTEGEDCDVTTIESIRSNGKLVNSIYNVQGQKLSDANRHGLYIINNKKVIK